MNPRVVNNRDRDTLGFLLAAWWYDLKTTGEIHRLFNTSVSLRGLLNEIGNDPIVWIGEIDGAVKVITVAWVKPYMDGAFFNYWNHEALRGTRLQGQITVPIYRAALKRFGFIIGTTWQRDLLRIHSHLGYRIFGPFEGLCKGKEAYLVTLTRDDFENSALVSLMTRLEARDGKRQESHG